MKSVKWYNNGIKEIQIKEDEIIPKGYKKGRLPKEKKVDKIAKIISKEDLYKNYIIENKKFIDLVDFYGITKKDLRCLITYYGLKKDKTMAVKNNTYKRTHEESVAVGKKSSLTQRNNWKNKSTKEKQEWSRKCSEIEINLSKEKKETKSKAYKDWWFSLTDDEREEINLKRSNTLKENWSKNGEDILLRMKSTEKENRKNRLCRSISEQLLYDRLILIYTDAEYDIKVDDRYPFFCDFYVPSKDLFIELNAHPSHGRLPFENLTYEEYSKYPQSWVDVYAKRDVEKRKTAINNKLNYIMIYPQATLEENLKINDLEFKELIEILYQTQK